MESARWLIVNNKLEEGLEALRKVAYTNGMQNAGDVLTMEVSRKWKVITGLEGRHKLTLPSSY